MKRTAGVGAYSSGKKPAEQSNYQKITLGFKSQDGDEIHYRIATDKKLRHLLSRYCIDKNMEYGVVRFSHEGIRVQGIGTIAERGLVDGDVIDAVVDQTGGGRLLG